MEITFIGTGYVGLVSGVMMTHLGHKVTCIDLDNIKINKLKNLKSPIFENNLNYYIKKYASTPNLSFNNVYDESLFNSEIIFVTVGTPENADGQANLDYIFQSVLSAAKYANPYCVFVIKSTVPPGTCSKIKEFLKIQGFNFEIVSNPEFLREGSAIYDFLNPDRIIIGAESEMGFERMRKLYKPLTDNGVAIIETDLSTSELIKYASNSFLATKIAFINEMADLCEMIGADINKLSQGMGLDKRIGSAFLKPGPGFGGSCFPKDIIALQHLTKIIDSNFLILDAVINANTNRPNLMLKKIIKTLNGTVRNKKISILGLTYKAGTDDLRNSPAIELINLLQNEGANVVAYDPQGMKNVTKYFDNKLICAKNPMEATKSANALIVVTEWEEFANLDYKKIKEHMLEPIIIDLRNILDKTILNKLGYKVYCVGHKSKKQQNNHSQQS